MAFVSAYRGWVNVDVTKPGIRMHLTSSVHSGGLIQGPS